jgi:putative transposase
VGSFLSPDGLPFSPSQLPRVPRPCRVLCDRAGVLTFPFSEPSAKNLVISYRFPRPRSYHATMPWVLKRYQEARCLHFVTFSCYARAPRLASAQARDLFEKTFEDTRQWYGFYVAGYVAMPEHVHLLLTEPERTKLSIALQMLKQNVAQRLRGPENGPLWQPRYYDFNVWSYAKQTEKLLYSSQPGQKRTGAKPGGVGVEQFPALPLRCRRRSGDRVALDGSQTGEHGTRAFAPEKGSQNPHPFGKLRAGSVAQTATRTGHPES